MKESIIHEEKKLQSTPGEELISFVKDFFYELADLGGAKFTEGATLTQITKYLEERLIVSWKKNLNSILETADAEEREAVRRLLAKGKKISSTSRATKDKVRRILVNHPDIYSTGNTKNKRYHWAESQIIYGSKYKYDEISICNELLGGSATIEDIANLMLVRSGYTDQIVMPFYGWRYMDDWAESYRIHYPSEITSPREDFLFHLIMMIKLLHNPEDDKIIPFKTTTIPDNINSDSGNFLTPITSAYSSEFSINNVSEFINIKGTKISEWKHGYLFNNPQSQMESVSYFGFQGPDVLKDIIVNIDKNIVKITDEEILTCNIENEIKWLKENINQPGYSNEKRHSNKNIIILALLHLNRSLQNTTTR
jgi:hypothetical protein